MKAIVWAISAVLFLGPDVSFSQTRRTDTIRKTTTITTTTTTTIVGQDSMSKHSADKKTYQNRKRTHTKNIYEEKKSK